MPPPPPTAVSKGPNNRAQRIFAKLVLLLATSAVISTVIAASSEDVIFQVLSQTEFVPRQTGGQANNKTNRVAIVHEPYGYISISDDTGKVGFLRYLSRAAFYEYHLPRAFLKVSQHREELTLEESEELQFRAGLRKRPVDWNPSKSGRNIFLDEPYRDKIVDRLFKRSHYKIIVSLGVGILSVLGILFLNNRISTNRQREDSTKRWKICSCFCQRPGIYFSKFLISPVWNGLWNFNTLVAIFGVAILGGLLASAGVMSAVAITTLLFNDRFCGHHCASSFLDASIDLEVDACIEGCALGRGGRFAILASCLWFLVLLSIAAVVAISIIASKVKSCSNLSRKWWWITVFLPLAVRSEQLVDIPELPVTSNDNHHL